MTLKTDVKFHKKLTCGLKNEMRNLANVHQSTQKCTLMESFCPKQKMCELKIHRGVMDHDNDK